jgi:hypothetical protein
MLKRITAAVLLLALLGLVWISDAVDNSTTSREPGLVSGSPISASGEAVPMNESSYRNFLRTVQSMYREDFNYSGSVLENYVNKTISEKDAMVATTSIFILTSHSLALLDINKPPEVYESAYNNTYMALTNMRSFLWNMSKFYETNKGSYLIQARKNLNESVSYYKAGQEGLATSKLE